MKLIPTHKLLLAIAQELQHEETNEKAKFEELLQAIGEPGNSGDSPDRHEETKN